MTFAALKTQPVFSADTLKLDAAAEVERIAGVLRTQVLKDLCRRGAVVGLSGGIDSSVTAALAVHAFGSKRVLALFMPERDSDPESLRFGRMVADWLGVESVAEDIAPALAASGCYER